MGDGGAMTGKQLVEALEKQGVKFEAAGDKLRINAPKGLLNERLKALLTRYKSEIMAVVREREHPAALASVYCFTCFKTGGKKEKYQLHRVAVSEEHPGWWELSCTRCGSKCFMRPLGGEINN